MYGQGVLASDWSQTSDLVYIIKAVDQIKIGRTTNLMVRLRNLQTNAAVPLEVIGLFPGGLVLERTLHAELYSFRLHGEWFAYNAIVHEVIRPYLFESMLEVVA